MDNHERQPEARGQLHTFVIRFFIYIIDSVVLWLFGWRKGNGSRLKCKQYVDPKTCGHYPKVKAVEICENRLRKI